MKQATRAAVLQAPRRFNIVDRPAPVAAAGEAVVRISSTAVCHTDLSIFTGEHPGVKYPVAMNRPASSRTPVKALPA
jgi:threonine dehydrogenase-like Zn-dependent dehydrogenase